MDKKILSVGYEIPGQSDAYINFRSERSLADADIVLFCTDTPTASYSDDSYQGLRSYTDEASASYKTDSLHWRKEISDALKAGKTVFLLLEKRDRFFLATGTKEYKNARTTIRHVDEHHSYEFLPISIGTITSSSGEQIEFVNSPAFVDFSKVFQKKMKYKAYLENVQGNPKVIFTAKDKNRILGATFVVGNGHLVVLPHIDYEYSDFVKTKKDKKGKEVEYWTADAIKFGNSLVGNLSHIDSALKQVSEITPPPEWSQDKKYKTKKEEDLVEEISTERKKIEGAEKKIKEVEEKLGEERIISGLLFEQGKPLEQAVTKALHILGYSADGYDDGTLELDQVIISPEGHRYVGECEGKDNKDIDITKFRQLSESLSADFAREEVSEKAFGILFGNPQRLMEPKERTLDFTQKCKTGAAREKIALVKTEDLFTVAKHVLETNDESFKKDCRDAIYSSLGKVVVFPSIEAKK